MHPRRPAVDGCHVCGRPACLACAVPVRGRVLCAQCAARHLGAEPPEESPEPASRRWPDPVAGALFLGALALSLVPWTGEGGAAGLGGDRGSLWPLLAAGLLLLASLIALGPVRRRGAFTRWAHPALGLLAALAILAALSTPGSGLTTPIPLLALLLAVAGAGAGLVRGRRGV